MSAGAVTAVAPGRVNLMGDHTDYTGGLVLPMALDLATTVTGGRGGDVVRLRSDSEPEPAIVPVAITAEEVASLEPAWARYVAAVLVETGLRVGFDGAVSTTVPVGAGLSSSAALEAAVALALGADDRGEADRPELAETLRRAEQLASGVPCGVMDQLVSLCGVDGHALLIDCFTLETATVPIPEAIEVVVVDSGVRRRLAEVPYAERRDELVRAASDPSTSDPVLRRRARHLATENQRVRDLARALTTGDVGAVGALLAESHRSLRDDAEVSTPAVDAVVERLSASPGVLGARLTGGGWGGCVVALCERGALPGEGWHVRPAPAASVRFG